MIDTHYNNLFINMTFGNFRKLCEFLDEKYTANSSSWKNSKVKEFERYFTWETNGQKITITHVYSEPLPENFREGGGYFPLFVRALFASLKESEFDLNEYYIKSTTEILEEVGLLNPEYYKIHNIIQQHDIREFERFILNSKFNAEAVKDWNRALNKITFEYIQLSKYIKSLELKGYCSFEKRYYVGNAEATKEQFNEWEKCKREVQQQREIKIQQEFILDKLANKIWYEKYGNYVVKKYRIHWNSNIFEWAVEDGYFVKRELRQKRNDTATAYINKCIEDNKHFEAFNVETPTKEEYNAVGNWIKGEL